MIPRDKATAATNQLPLYNKSKEERQAKRAIIHSPLSGAFGMVQYSEKESIIYPETCPVG
jgi:hypothetical protein